MYGFSPVSVHLLCCVWFLSCRCPSIVDVYGFSPVSVHLWLMCMVSLLYLSIYVRCVWFLSCLFPSMWDVYGFSPVSVHLCEMYMVSLLSLSIYDDVYGFSPVPVHLWLMCMASLLSLSIYDWYCMASLLVLSIYGWCLWLLSYICPSMWDVYSFSPVSVHLHLICMASLLYLSIYGWFLWFLTYIWPSTVISIIMNILHKMNLFSCLRLDTYMPFCIGLSLLLMVLNSGLSRRFSFQQSLIVSVMYLGTVPRADNLGRNGPTSPLLLITRWMISTQQKQQSNYCQF